jgi:CheY-like chemotaxis protein
MVRTILIAEDHPTMRDAMRLVLQQDGVEIEAVADGRAALEALRRRPPDLLFLDLNIPGANGIDVLAAVRADPRAAGTRVIVVTAVGEEGRAEALRCGADEYVTKPFSPTALLETVERVLATDATPGE